MPDDVMAIPLQRLVRLGVVVRDARESARKLARFYGIGHWHVVEHRPERVTGATVHGFASPNRYLSAVGVAHTAFGEVTFQLLQPIDGWSSFQEFLLTRGEGIHHVCTGVLEPPEAARLLSWLDEEGVAIAQSECLDGVLDSYLIDTRELLGGFQVEILSPRRRDWAERSRFDEEWDFSADVPAAGPLLAMHPGPRPHIGVVVRDLMSTVRNWAHLFKIDQWTFINWHKAPGSLTDPEYMGRPVDHAYFTTMLQFGNMLGFEIIQPTFGPSHYKEDFLQPLGEGIHHISFHNLPTKEAWDLGYQQLSSIGAPVVMGGVIGEGYKQFYYVDTRQYLGGYVTEVLYPLAVSKGPPTIKAAMRADFSTPARPVMAARVSPGAETNRSDRAAHPQSRIPDNPGEETE